MRILIAGLGSIGQRHVRNLRALMGDRVEILAYRVRRLGHVLTPAMQADAARNVEREYNIRAFEDLDEALSYRPRAAFICNPTTMHVPVALSCVQSGCDLFLEKPVSNSLEGIAELMEAVQSRGRVAMVGYQLRFHPCFRALQDIVRSGTLGSLLAVRAHVGEHLPDWHPYEDYRQTYAARSDLGGGVVVTQIHEFDYLYALFGAPRRIFSVGGHFSRLEIDVEDTGSSLMECEWEGRSLPVHLQQDYLQRPASRGCEVIGDEGKVIMDLSALRVTLYGRDGKVASSQCFEGFDRNQMFLDQTSHFLECLVSRGKPAVDLSDGVWSLRMALAARESMATRSAIELEAVEDYAASVS